MGRSRFIIENRETGIIDGLYLDRVFAEKSAAMLREIWPALSWEVEPSTDPYPPPDRVCTGHLRAKKILKQRLSEDTATETAL